jgi:hypothetical protein
MHNRRAFLSVIVLAAATTTAAFAGSTRSGELSLSSRSATTIARPAAQVDARISLSWVRVFAAYQTVLGMTVSQLPIFVVPPQIEGIQDGPDGIGPLGIKGILPKQRDGDPPPPGTL